jgi:hypothetical protein
MFEILGKAYVFPEQPCAVFDLPSAMSLGRMEHISIYYLRFAIDYWQAEVVRIWAFGL